MNQEQVKELVRDCSDRAYLFGIVAGMMTVVLFVWLFVGFFQSHGLLQIVWVKP